MEQIRNAAMCSSQTLYPCGFQVGGTLGTLLSLELGRKENMPEMGATWNTGKG
jgi:hypothetical protein